jgi:hypothetical protein
MAGLLVDIRFRLQCFACPPVDHFKRYGPQSEPGQEQPLVENDPAHGWRSVNRCNKECNGQANEQRQCGREDGSGREKTVTMVSPCETRGPLIKQNLECEGTQKLLAP